MTSVVYKRFLLTVMKFLNDLRMLAVTQPLLLLYKNKGNNRIIVINQAFAASR